MRIEYVIISIILMLVVVLAVVSFLSGAVPSVREAFENIKCGLGLIKCQPAP